MSRTVYLLDLKDPDVASAYDDVHQPGNVPEAVLRDIVAAGILEMEIYRFGDRLVMITESDPDAHPSDRVSSEASKIWEKRMDAFQRPLAGVADGVKWQDAKRIFKLAEHLNLGKPAV